LKLLAASSASGVCVRGIEIPLLMMQMIPRAKAKAIYVNARHEIPTMKSNTGPPKIPPEKPQNEQLHK